MLIDEKKKDYILWIRSVIYLLFHPKALLYTYNCYGRSSDLFQLYAFPANLPVARGSITYIRTYSYGDSFGFAPNSLLFTNGEPHTIQN